MYGYGPNVPTAKITVTDHPMPFGLIHRSFEWHGKSRFVEVSAYLPRLGDNQAQQTDDHHFQLGPYRLRIVKRYPLSDSYLCVREGPVGRLTESVYRTRQRLLMLKTRLILTAYVWGLGDRPEPYEVPSWRHIHLVRRLFGRKP